jgi:sphinganine-1-phosphate aldolase
MLDKKYKSLRKNFTYKMPEKPMKDDTILRRMKEGADEANKIMANGTQVSGCIYTNDQEHWEMLSEVMKTHITSNPLHMSEFIQIGQFEAEIIRMTLELFHGPKEACGITTSGGTESILMAVLAYREQAMKERNVTKPNLVISVNAHAAFDKACFYFGVELRKVNNINFLPDYEGIEREIDSNTIALVASAPDFPYGNIDNTPRLATLALKYGIGCHVDCCLGSYIVPFIEEAGFKLPY